MFVIKDTEMFSIYVCPLEMRQSCVFHNTSEQYRLVELYDRLTDDQQIWSF